MAYFKIGTTDISDKISGLKIDSGYLYNSRTNAKGNEVVDYIGVKRQIEITIIPLAASEAASLLTLIGFNNTISFLNPNTNTLETGVQCIAPKVKSDYYTINNNQTLLKAYTVTFQEL